MSLEQLNSLALDFAEAHPQDAARLLAELPPIDIAAFLESCPTPTAAAVTGFITAQEFAPALAHLLPERIAALFDCLPRERVATTLRRLGPEEQSGIMELLPLDLARSLRTLLRYDDDSAGALMAPQVLTVTARLTVAQALKSLDRNRSQLRYYVYVVDEDDRLVGVVSLRALMTADPGKTVESIMSADVYRISARATGEAILQHHGWRELHALPVVDERNTLVGVLRYESMQKLARGDRPSSVGDKPLAALGELFWVGSQRVFTEFFGLVRRGTR